MPLIREWLLDFTNQYTRKMSAACPPAFSLLSSSRVPDWESKTESTWLSTEGFRACVNTLRSSPSISSPQPSVVVDNLEAVLSSSRRDVSEAPCNTTFHILIVTPQVLLSSYLPTLVQQSLHLQVKHRISLVASVDFPEEPGLPLKVLGRFGDRFVYTLPANGQTASFRTMRPSWPHRPSVPGTLADELLQQNGTVFDFNHIIESHDQRCSLATAVASVMKEVANPPVGLCSSERARLLRPRRLNGPCALSPHLLIFRYFFLLFVLVLFLPVVFFLFLPLPFLVSSSSSPFSLSFFNFFSAAPSSSLFSSSSSSTSLLVGRLQQFPLLQSPNLSPFSLSSYAVVLFVVTEHQIIPEFIVSQVGNS